MQELDAVADKIRHGPPHRHRGRRRRSSRRSRRRQTRRLSRDRSSSPARAISRRSRRSRCACPASRSFKEGDGLRFSLRDDEMRRSCSSSRTAARSTSAALRRLSTIPRPRVLGDYPAHEASASTKGESVRRPSACPATISGSVLLPALKTARRRSVALAAYRDEIRTARKPDRRLLRQEPASRQFCLLHEDTQIALYCHRTGRCPDLLDGPARRRRPRAPRRASRCSSLKKKARSAPGLLRLATGGHRERGALPDADASGGGRAAAGRGQPRKSS